jgi:periplasmic protein TonB
MVSNYRLYDLPWEMALEEERHFGVIVRKVVIAITVLSVIFSFVPLPEISHDRVDKVPQRFAKLILDKPKPLPPPSVILEQPKAEELRPVESKVVEERKPRPEPVVKDEPKPVDRAKEARKKASVAGLLPFADDLADLRDNKAVANVTSSRNLAGAAGAAARAERSMITSKAGKGSGGINTAAMSRDTGGSGLAGHDTTKVSSTVAGLGTGAAIQRPTASELPSRSREEIEMVFDQNKGAIYALYNRALRRDPTLQGKLVLKLTIEPSGVVSFCEIVSSEVADDQLLIKLVKRIKLFRFDAKEVAPITTTKPIDFFPA